MRTWSTLPSRILQQHEEHDPPYIKTREPGMCQCNGAPWAELCQLVHAVMQPAHSTNGAHSAYVASVGLWQKGGGRAGGGHGSSQCMLAHVAQAGGKAAGPPMIGASASGPQTASPAHQVHTSLLGGVEYELVVCSGGTEHRQVVLAAGLACMACLHAWGSGSCQATCHPSPAIWLTRLGSR